MANWGAGASGAVSGAGLGAAVGSAIVPGFGTVVGAGAGGIIGGLSGLFGGDDSEQSFKDPQAAERQSVIDQALHSHIGKDTAAFTGGQIRNQANREYQSLASNPNFAGNASVLSSGYNKIQGSAENSMISANLSGAAQDMQARQQALSDSQREGEFDWNQYRDQRDFNNQPSAFQSIATSVLSSAAAAGTQALIGKAAKG